MTIKPQPTIPFLVIAADPESTWRLERLDVDAVSVDEARRLARGELAALKRDHWSIQLVRERKVAA